MHMSITAQKQALRKEMRQRRSQIPLSIKKEYDQWVCQSLAKKIEEHNYQVIHCYLPMGTEINIYPLIDSLLQLKLTLVAPKTLAKGKLKHLVLQSLDLLEKGVYGTSHPAGDQSFSGKYDLILVPGLSFDHRNYRLGYGGGYYDNFLTKHPNARKVGLFYPFQEAEFIPTEPHDVSLDEILTNKDFPGLSNLL